MSNSVQLNHPGEIARDTGAAAVLLSESDAWKADVQDRIDVLAATGIAFTVTEVREVVTEEPEKPQSWGAAFLVARQRGQIVPIGYATSPRTARHAGPVRIWIGAKTP